MRGVSQSKSSLTHLVLLGIVVGTARYWPGVHKATLHV
jgi:hypothetical protein